MYAIFLFLVPSLKEDTFDFFFLQKTSRSLVFHVLTTWVGHISLQLYLGQPYAIMSIFNTSKHIRKIENAYLLSLGYISYNMIAN